MKLLKLINNIEEVSIFNQPEGGLFNPEVKGIALDSGEVKKDYLFAAVKGVKTDGHIFIPQAINKGCRVVLAQRKRIKSIFKSLNKNQRKNTVFITVDNTREAVSFLAREFYRHPAQNMKITGITGTNGKTTVSYLIEAILKAAFLKSAKIGTVGYFISKKNITAKHTTPDAIKLQGLLSLARKNKINHLIMEVSSHSLEQQRVAGINFNNAIFTNLSRDHLDYHKNYHNYFQAKLKLFKNLDEYSTAIINLDDKWAKKIIEKTKANVLTYGLKPKADIRAFNIKEKSSGLELKVNTPLGQVSLKSLLIGMHNVYNILAAVALAVSYGIDFFAIKKGILTTGNIPGRLERIDNSRGIKIFVDYAHTPDALEKVLKSLRKYTQKKLILVFGCGGERDQGKRIEMGRVAERLADFVVLCNDNPRSEDPLKIISDISKGIKNTGFLIEPDRFKAIEKAITNAKKNDIILVAGKGHEDYQIIKDKRINFNDVKAVKKILNNKKHANLKRNHR